jgi:hypothetical protein
MQRYALRNATAKGRQLYLQASKWCWSKSRCTCVPVLSRESKNAKKDKLVSCVTKISKAGTAREMAQRKGGCVNNNNIVERNALSQIFIFDGASFGPCVRWCYALVSRFVDG